MARGRKYGILFDKSTTNKFRKQMEQQFGDIEDDIEGRLDKAASIVKAQSDEYVPEDTLRTKHSWYYDIEKSDGQMKLTFGYDRNNQIDYLPLIYLNPYNMRFRKPGARSMWLHHAVADTKRQVNRVIQEK